MNKIFVILALIYESCIFSGDSFKDAKLLYENNRDEFRNVIHFFEKEKIIFSLGRLEHNYSLNIFENSNTWLVYNLVLNKGKDNLTILIDTSYNRNESLFWESNNYNVKSTTKNLSLIAFLDSNQIPIQSFIKLKNFLSNNKLFMISHDIDSEVIIIMFNEIEGYIYEPNDEIPKYIEASELKKIDENIYYFKKKP